jgi:hypothetical protein
MSHLHHINGQSDIADHYRVFLERSQAARLAGGADKIRKKTDAEASDSELDPDQDTGGDPQEEPENEDDTDSEDGTKTEDGTEPPGGFGKHYA